MTQIEPPSHPRRICVCVAERPKGQPLEGGPSPSGLGAGVSPEIAVLVTQARISGRHLPDGLRPPGALVDPGALRRFLLGLRDEISGSRSPPGLTTGGADGAASAVEIGQPTGIGGRSSSIRFCARSSRIKATTNATRTATPTDTTTTTDTRTPYATAPGMTIFHCPTAPISPVRAGRGARKAPRVGPFWPRGAERDRATPECDPEVALEGRCYP
jgi:hypothetical protein